MTLGWNRLGTAPGHGNRAKEHVTEWTPPSPLMDGLIWFLLSHFHFPCFHTLEFDWKSESAEGVRVNVFTHIRMRASTSVNDRGRSRCKSHPPQPPPRLFICFQHALFTPSLKWAPDHTPATACDPEQMFPLCMKAMLLHLQLYLVHCFWKQPKNKWHRWSAVRKKQNARW